MVTVRNPSRVSVDATSGNQRFGPPTETRTRAYLSQQSVTVLSSYVEKTGGQDTTISTFTLMLPPDVLVNSDSTIVDENGKIYQVNGSVAERRGLGNRVLFRAASMHLISDLQT